MKSKFSRARDFLSVVSKDTHLWVIGVLVGSVILSVSFYLEPFNSDFFSRGNRVNAAEKEAEDPEVYNISTKLSEGVETPGINIDRTLEVVSVNENHDLPVSMEEYDMLCRIVTTEAGSEDVEGQMLIANVVMNRVKSDIFPDTVEEVILSPGQFDPVMTGAFYSAEPTDEAKEAVIRALSGEDASQGALYFQKSAATIWGDYEFLFRYGNHSFYK
ncbi:MAG: cell wall hydrolase [Lachnospiraceae bacterium]|nr:cell wall hydrolase [Lachnospiraceae bacterium]